jgi:large subunit ribosomal protein L29
MKTNELRKLSTEELVKKVESNKHELFDLRLKQSTGSLEKPSQIKNLRKEVARIKTILKEREGAENGEN